MSNPGSNEDRESEVKLMMNDLEWPKQLLPLRRPGDGRWQSAFLAPLAGPVVYHGNVWDSKLVIEDLEFTRYPSYWAIYDDGWRVD